MDSSLEFLRLVFIKKFDYFLLSLLHKRALLPKKHNSLSRIAPDCRIPTLSTKDSFNETITVPKIKFAFRIFYAIGVPFLTDSSGFKSTTSPSSGTPPIINTSDLKPAIRLGGKFTTATT